MKKFTLFSLMVVFALASFAQVPAAKKAQKFTKKETSTWVKRYDNKADFQKAMMSFGDTLFYDDFGTGGPGSSNLPTGWTTADLDTYQGNGYVWQWTDVGATGPTTSGYEYILASTTAANGWMIFDSDNYGQGSYDAYLYSPVYDFTGYDAVAISFQELYQRWGNESTNPYGGNPTYVGVSIDGGTTWTEIEIHADFDVKESTDNPGYMMVNISNIAGGESNVKIYFRMSGLWDYWWQIDDLAIIEAPHNDLKINETFVTSITDFGTQGIAFNGYYSQLPLSQITPMFFQADVYNSGVDAQTNVTLTCEVSDDNGLVFTGTGDTSNIPFDSTYSIVADWFQTTTAGHYSVDFTVTQDQTEELPSDNVAGPVDWRITTNDIMARDYSYTRAISPSMYTGSADGDLMGVDYTMSADAEVNSLSVFIDWRATPGATLIGQIYNYDNGNRVLQISSEEYVIAAEDLGHWVDIPLVTIDPTDNDLVADATYLCAFEFYWGGDETVQAWIGADDEGPHIYNIVSSLRIGQDWYWVANIPMIRLNLSTATFKPEWTSVIANELCAKSTEDWSTSVTVEATDPNGLSLTFDTLSTPDFVTAFTDNGNGTATFDLTMTPDNVGNSYHFEYSVSNGVESNEVFMYADVDEYSWCVFNGVDDVLAADAVKIYPNPTSNVVNIMNAEGADIYVYNVIGEVVKSVHNADLLTNIDLSDLNEGTYIVRVINGDNVTSQAVNLVK